MSLTRMIKKIKKERNELKILFLGLDNAGKTTIIHKLFNKEIEQIPPTFGYQIHSFEYKFENGPIVNLNVLDVGGQLNFRKYWSNYYEKLDGVVFVYDITDERIFDDFLKKAVEENNNKEIPFLVLANKCDLLLEESDIKEKKLENETMRIFKCSGKTGENLHESFKWFIQNILKGEIKI